MPGAPYITALIDTYNRERFIAEAIESVLQQDFPALEMEILVVDDGSTDATAEVARRYRERVRYIPKANGGQASALNLGFEQSRGEIIAFLDADDVWMPRKLRCLAEEFAKHPEAGLVYHPCRYFTADKEAWGEETSFTAFSGHLPERPEVMIQLSGMTTSAVALRRSTARELMPIPERIRVFADSYLMATAIFAAPVVGLDEPLTGYRVHGGNLTSFSEPDPVRTRQSEASFRAALEETQGWLERHGFDPRQGAADALLRRMELELLKLGFLLKEPGRREFFSYLLKRHRLFSELWPPRYKVFHLVTAAGGFLLGYKGFHLARKAYRDSSSLLRLRETLLPSQKVETKPADRARTTEPTPMANR
jgi:hypothetical protein